MRLEYSKAPYWNIRIAVVNATIALIVSIAIPITTSVAVKFPIALRSIKGIGAVSGKNVKNRTRPESGEDMNKVTAYIGPKINSIITPKNPDASLAVGTAEPIAISNPVNIKKLRVNKLAPMPIQSGSSGMLLRSKLGKDN